MYMRKTYPVASNSLSQSGLEVPGGARGYAQDIKPVPPLQPDRRSLRIIERLAMLVGPVEEIAAVLRVDKETFDKFRAECPEAQRVFERGVALGKLGLRRIQLELAKANAAMEMAMYVGSNYLGQSRRDVAHNNIVGGKPGELYEFTLKLSDRPLRGPDQEQH